MENHDKLLSGFSMTLCCFPISACFWLYLAYFSCYLDPVNIYKLFGNKFKDEIRATLHLGTVRLTKRENGAGICCRRCRF